MAEQILWDKGQVQQKCLVCLVRKRRGEGWLASDGREMEVEDEIMPTSTVEIV